MNNTEIESLQKENTELKSAIANMQEVILRLTLDVSNQTQSWYRCPECGVGILINMKFDSHLEKIQ